MRKRLGRGQLLALCLVLLMPLGVNASTATARPVMSAGPVVAATRVGLNPSALAADPVHHRFFVALDGPVDDEGAPTGSGSIVVLDGTTGRLLRTIRLGAGIQAEAALAYDAPRNRLYASVSIARHDAVLVIDPTRGRVLRHLPYGGAAIILPGGRSRPGLDLRPCGAGAARHA